MGMKKCVVLFILLFVLPVGIFAQDYKDIIYLKDGSIVKGIISENILDRYVVVKTSFGEKLEIYVADIEIIEKEKFPSEMPKPKDQLILAKGVKLSGVILK